MKTVRFLLAILMGLSIATAVPAAEIKAPAEAFMLSAPLTLEEAYRLALKRSEDVAISQQAIEAAEGHFTQAFGLMLPSVSFLITRFQQDAAEGGGSSSDGASGNLQRRKTPQEKFVFSQPIFGGFKQFIALRGAKAEKAQKRYERRQAEELLFANVVDAFYAYTQAQKDLEILNNIHELLEERMGDLRGRAKLGRSRSSEVQSAISDMMLIEADREEAKLTEGLAKRLLQFYVGRQITAGVEPEKGIRPELPRYEDYLLRLDHRSDVMAAKEIHHIAQTKTALAKADLLPTVTLDGNYYTRRVGFQKDIDWDVLLSVDIPIFQGTETYGLIRSAAAEEKAAELNYFKIKRLAELDIESTYETVRTSRAQENAMRRALRASQENFRLLKDEYQHNLVNNLDVLETLRRHRDVHRRFNETRFKAKKDYWRLKVASGETPIYEAV